MERSPKLQRRLDALGIGDLKEVDFEHLKNCLDTVDIPTFSSTIILQVFLCWLFERLSNLDLSDPDQITAWCGAVQCHGFVKDRVINAYRQWQAKATKLDPFSSRRCEILACEIGRIYPSTPHEVAGAEAIITKPASDPNEVIEIASNSSASSSVEFICHDDSSSLSKLNNFCFDIRGSTLQTAISVEDNDIFDHHAKMGKNKKKRSADQNEGSVQQEKRVETPANEVPRGRYVCNRCNQPGAYRPTGLSN